MIIPLIIILIIYCYVIQNFHRFKKQKVKCTCIKNKIVSIILKWVYYIKLKLKNYKKMMKNLLFNEKYIGGG